MAPGTTSLRHMSPRTITPPTPRMPPAFDIPLRPSSAPRNANTGPAQGTPPLRWLRLDVGDHGREALVEGGDSGLVEHEPGLGGVVVGRARPACLASGSPAVARTLVVVLPLAHRLAQDPRPVLDLVHIAGAGECREHAAEHTPAPERQRSRDRRQAGEAGDERRERSPARLLLDHGAASTGTLQALSDPLRRLALARRARRPLDLGQVRDDGAKRLLGGLGMCVGARQSGPNLSEPRWLSPT